MTVSNVRDYLLGVDGKKLTSPPTPSSIGNEAALGQIVFNTQKSSERRDNSTVFDRPCDIIRLKVRTVTLVIVWRNCTDISLEINIFEITVYITMKHVFFSTNLTMKSCWKTKQIHFDKLVFIFATSSYTIWFDGKKSRVLPCVMLTVKRHNGDV